MRGTIALGLLVLLISCGPNNDLGLDNQNQNTININTGVPAANSPVATPTPTPTPLPSLKPEGPVTGVRTDREALEIKAGGNMRIKTISKAYNNGAFEEITDRSQLEMFSLDQSIAEVDDDGVIFAKKAGQTTLQINFETLSTFIQLTVTE